MKKITVILIALLLVATFVSGCNTTTPGSSPGASAPADTNASSTAAVKQQEYGYVTYVSSLPVWEFSKAGIQFAAEKLGAKVTVVGPVDVDAQLQNQAIEELIAKKVDGIIICPLSAEVQQAPLKKAMEAGIPVITVISDVGGGLETHYGFVAADGLSVGRTGATFVAENLLVNQTGKVAILTMPGNEVHDRRRTGYENTLAQYPNVQIVQVADTKADPNIGLQKAAEIIQANPDLNCFICTDATGGASAARAVQEAGKVGQIKIIAMDRDDDLLEFIKQGVVTATLVDQHYMCGFMAMNYCYWIKNGYIKDVPDFSKSGISPVPAFTEVNVAVVTTENVDQFYFDAFKAQFN